MVLYEQVCFKWYLNQGNYVDEIKLLVVYNSMVIYLSPGFGAYFILGLALRRVDGCLFFGFTDNLCFAAELSSNCFVSPTFKSGSGIFVLFVVLCIVVSVKASHKTVKILTLEIN